VSKPSGVAPSPTGFAHWAPQHRALQRALLTSATAPSRFGWTTPTWSKPEYRQLIYETLHWLGLEWDEGPDGAALMSHTGSRSDSTSTAKPLPD
jgi:glutamyl-tRNA synthetase